MFFWQILHTKTIYHRSLCQSGSTKNPTTNKREDLFLWLKKKKHACFFVFQKTETRCPVRFRCFRYLGLWSSAVPSPFAIDCTKKDEFYPSLLPRPLLNFFHRKWTSLICLLQPLKKSGEKTRKKDESTTYLQSDEVDPLRQHLHWTNSSKGFPSLLPLANCLPSPSSCLS